MKGKGVESFSFIPVKSFWAGDQGVNLEYIQGVEKQIRQKDRDYREQIFFKWSSQKWLFMAQSKKET